MKLLKCLVTFVVILLSNNSFSLEKTDLEKRFHVKISTDVIEVAKKIEACRFAPATHHQVRIMLPLLQSFLSKYKKNVIANNLKTVYLVGQVAVGNTLIGGTYSLKGRFIALSAYMDLEYFAHHEFSSLLIKKYYNYEEQWVLYNGVGYTGYTNYKAMKANKNLRKEGFLFDYSRVSFEEDFNVLAGFYLYKPSWIHSIGSKNKKILYKVRLLEKFYKNLSR